jgi:hypothetical protein
VFLDIGQPPATARNHRSPITRHENTNTACRYVKLRRQSHRVLGLGVVAVGQHGSQELVHIHVALALAVHVTRCNQRLKGPH